MSAAARHRLRTTFAVVMLTGIAVAACGGSSGGVSVPGGGVFDADDVQDLADDIGDGGDGGGDAIGLGDTDAPVVVTIDGVAFGYRDGSCRVDDELVRFQVYPDSGVLHGDSSHLMNNVDITWHPTLGHLPYVAQHAVFMLNRTIEAAPAPFSLIGSANSLSAASSSWEGTVSGTTAEFDLTLVDSMQLGDESQTIDVRITARCDNPILGNGPPLGASPVGDENQMVDPRSVLASLADGHVEVTFQGSAHSLDNLTWCTIDPQQVQAEGDNNDLSVRVGYNEVEIQVGDPRLMQERPRFHLPEMIQIPYEGDSTRTWSGTLVDDDGKEEDVSVAVTCAG